ncbi:kelch-like protein 7 [Uloborus diversus]|uniref:kelch-like protein 7 n=1 Tax=Uloborus diversus TaxID=327109 RepID=UPI002408F3F5|nr:kelch-like protein 7 [Uloborus diversus]
MYTGELKVTCQELPEVYKAARKLGIEGALSKCIELLHVTPDHIQNMVNLYVSARKLNQLDATVRAFKIIVANFERLVMTKEFLDLEINQVVEIFSADEMGARSEIIIFLGALKWINYKYLDREGHINSIFDCIRFGLMNMEEILACFHPPILPGIMLRPKIREALLNATW